MAKIRFKTNKRYRVQITTTKEVWDCYVKNQKLANELKVEVDYSTDFSNWLSRQNEQVAQALKILMQEQTVESDAVVGCEQTDSIIAVEKQENVANGLAEKNNQDETQADEDDDY